MNKYVLAALGAGASWGGIGFFARNLEGVGVSPEGTIVLRCGVAAICFGILILLTDPAQFRVHPRDFWCFFGTGILSLFFFTFCYFNALPLIGVSVSAALLYTAPTIVTLLSALLFKERMTTVKWCAVALAFLGCGLASGITEGIGSASVKGILLGLGSGLGYALYTIFSRYAMRRGYSGSTINFYSSLLACLAAAVIWGNADLFRAAVSSPRAVFLFLGIGSVSGFLPYLLYTYSLTGLENGKASVLCSSEPIVAAIVGVCFFEERLTVAAVLGVLAVIGSILLLNLKLKPKKKSDRT